MAVAGLVLGIAGIVLCFFGWFSIIALPASIVGLVLACIARKKNKTGIATAGMVVGIVAVVLSAIVFFTCGILLIGVVAEASKL